jgi:hypothetical protein
MHPKDFFLALILGLAIADTTYQWTTFLNVQAPSALGRAWLSLRADAAVRPGPP